MKPDKIKEIIGSKIKELKKLGSKLNKDLDKDAIHEFRIAVKSIRSFLRMLRMAYNEPGPKLPGKFKRLYHIAGAIRDAQLELENLTANNISLPVYSGKLNNDIKRQKKEWDRHYSEKIFRKIKKRLAGYEYDTLSPDALAAFYNMKVNGMKTLSNARPCTSAQIHNIRKQAKDIIYTTKLAQKDWKPAYKQIKHIPLAQLEDIATVIGDYNDDRIQLEHLASFSSPETEPTEINTIKKITKKDAAKLKKGKKEILEMVKKLQIPKQQNQKTKLIILNSKTAGHNINAQKK